MATTATKIQETLLQDAGSTAGAESAGSAAGAYRSDEEILGIGDSATGAGTSEQTSRAGDEKDALGAQASEGKERTRNTEDTENTEGTEKSDKRDKTESGAPTEIPAEFEQIFATPGTGEKLREIYQREAEYRAIFPTIGEARALREAFATAEDAKAAIEARHELARVDALVESGDPEAHVELMTGIRERDPRAFRRLAQTFAERLAEVDPVAYPSVAS